MVALATARCARLGLPNVVCRLADAKALPYADATFDAATCCMGLMCVAGSQARQALLRTRPQRRPAGRIRTHLQAC